MRALAVGLAAALTFFATPVARGALEGGSVLEIDSSHASPTVALAAGSGITVLDGEVGWGFSFLGAREWQSGGPMMVGLETGLYFWSRGHGQRDPLGTQEPLANGSASLLRVLPVLYHQFFIPLVPGAVPFVGVSAGPALYFVNGTGVSGAGVRETSVFFEILFRPGVHLILTDDAGLWFEPRFGLVKSKPVLSPQVSLSWFL